MERKREDKVQKPVTGPRAPKEKLPQTPTQTQQQKPEAKEKTTTEQQPRPPKKLPKKPQEDTDEKTTTEEVTTAKQPPRKRGKVRQGKLTNEQTGAPPKKTRKKPKEAAIQITANVGNVIPTKEPQKKPQEVTEAMVNNKPSKIAVDGGKPVRVVEDDDAIQKTKRSRKTRQANAEDSVMVTQRPAIRMREPSLQTQMKIGQKDDEFRTVLPSDSVYRDTTGPEESGTKLESPKYSPETFTGLNELPALKLFIIFILWLPRFFIPWMADWHEYNVFILMNPDLFEQHVEYLFKHNMILLFVKCVIGIVCAIIADLANMRFYVYLTLLFLFLFCPVSGGIVDMVLRSRTYDQRYYKYWVWCIIMMRWAMAIPFIMMPVQFACIFLEKNDMSRKAHYNWAGIFFFFEFVNACVSFWVIPAKCPTKDWIQIAVWVCIGMLMFTVIFFTFIIFLLIKETRHTFLTCLKKCGKHEAGKLERITDTSHTTNTPIGTPGFRRACLKLLIFVLMLVPLFYMSFVFSVMDRFLPDDDWDKHQSLSATSMFVLGKIVGVVAMVITMFIIRKFGKLTRLGKIGKLAQKISRFKFFSTDVMVLGLPHLMSILALSVLIGRFEILTKGYSIKKGREHFGPIPDANKTVVLFFNLMLSNRTICVGSEHFYSVKIRPFRYAAVEIFDPGVDTINITVTPEPGSTPVVATNFAMNNFKKGRWVAYTISISGDATKYVKHKTGPRNYYAKPRVVRLNDNEINKIVRPNYHPLLIIPNNYNNQTGRYKYWIKYEGRDDNLYEIEMNEQSKPNTYSLPMDPFIWKLVGCCNYSIRISDSSAVKPDDLIPKYTFRVNSIHRWPLYYLVSYSYTPIDPTKTYTARELPVWFKIFLVAETARWDNEAHLPDKTELQQDWAIKLALSLAGMAAGGVLVGVIYTFWLDLPLIKFPATTMAVFWAFWAGAAEPARLKLIDIDPPTETVVMTLPAKLLTAHIPFTVLHFVAATLFYHPKFNFRGRSE